MLVVKKRSWRLTGKCRSFASGAMVSSESLPMIGKLLDHTRA